MIISMKPNAPKEELDKIVAQIHEFGCKENMFFGAERVVIGLLGDVRGVDKSRFQMNPFVEDIIKVSEPYKKANKQFHPKPSIVDCNGIKVGGKKIAIIAGPCSVETEEQMTVTAKEVKSAGACMLRGGAFKPRTSPYAFQGLEEEGIELMKKAKEKTGLPLVSELMSIDHLPFFVENVDVIQIGARNMQNFALLKACGKVKKPILLKRGLSNTIEELLMSAEYILAGGNPNVILCERGIRTFETATRNTLDISAIPIIKKLSHLPVIVDPSHAGGINWLVPTLSKAAIAAGADGLIIEVHNDPKNALCDGAQSLDPKQFANLMVTLKKYAEIEGREI